MRLINKCATAVALITISNAALAQVVQPGDLGIVEAPVAGSKDVPLVLVPRAVLHTARVAFKAYAGGGEVTSAQLDGDEVLAVWEIAGTADGRAVEADVRPDGTLAELEVEITGEEVPAAITSALAVWFPGFNAAGLVEKSIRPSEAGLPEIWYEFSGVEFDVEVRSDGGAALVEPA